ncbi:MAG: glycosyltransferase [Oligoflexia bacterium]|nr:glycosyltransferase [Oligoflexia bacterium]
MLPVPTILHIPCDLAGGGAERLVLELCSRASPGFRHAVAPVHATGALRPAFRAAGVQILDLDRRRGWPGGTAILRLARLARGFDIVHTHLWAGDTWGRMGAALAHHPVVVTTEHNTRPESAWRRRLSVGMHPLSQRIVAVSEAVSRSLLEGGVPASKVQVIPNGVDLGRFSPAPPRLTAPRRVLGIGRLVPQKGFDLLAEAVARCPGLQLDLLGEGPQAPALRAAGAHLLGWRADVRPALAAADLIVIPSRWEGFGLVAVEAMASGLPVIVTDVPGLRDVVGEAALAVPPQDVEALVGALRRLSVDAELRSRLARAGPARARAFSIQACVGTYETLYAELLTAT